MNIFVRSSIELFIATTVAILPLFDAAAQQSGQRQGREYVIDAQDVLTVTFWQQPNLNTTARVAADGKIYLPVIGRIQAAGYTPTRLADSIVEQMRVYNKSITQATVTVSEYVSKTIYVNGHVGEPGGYSFEVLPNLWGAILRAGGPLETAALDNITIVRANGETVPVNLASALEKGDLNSLPQLSPGDAVYVPGLTGAISGAAGEGTAGVSPRAGLFSQSRQLIYVFGQVAAPGAYPYEQNIDVLQAIIQAGGFGGPSGRASQGPSLEPDMSAVRVISNTGNSAEVLTIDLNHYVSKSAPLPVYLRPGDTVFVPQRAGIGSFVANRALLEVVRGTAAIATSYILLNVLLK